MSIHTCSHSDYVYAGLACVFVCMCVSVCPLRERTLVQYTLLSGVL